MPPSASTLVRDADLVTVEFNVNDGPATDSPLRLAHERLLRRLLALPSAPAVVEVLVYRWTEAAAWTQNSAPFHIGGTDNLRSLATYYHLPTLSTRSLFWDTAFDGVTPASPEPHNILGVWHADYDHPNSAGHGAILDMLVAVLRRAAASLVERPFLAEELAAAARRPAPLYRGNEAAAGAACFVGDAFRGMAVAAEGFAWKDEGRAGAPKWGFTANATGAWVEFELDTSCGGLDSANATAGLTALGVSHLRSYEGMAVAELACVSGCACAPTRLDGRLEFRVSQTYISRALVGRAARCRVRVAVLDGGAATGGTSSSAA